MSADSFPRTAEDELYLVCSPAPHAWKLRDCRDDTYLRSAVRLWCFEQGSADMTQRTHEQLKSLEGRRVSVALADGSRLDDCDLVSVGRGRAATLWVFTCGLDTFIPHRDVLDIWQTV